MCLCRQVRSLQTFRKNPHICSNFSRIFSHHCSLWWNNTGLRPSTVLEIWFTVMQTVDTVWCLAIRRWTPADWLIDWPRSWRRFHCMNPFWHWLTRDWDNFIEHVEDFTAWCNRMVRNLSYHVSNSRLRLCYGLAMPSIVYHFEYSMTDQV